MRKLHQLYAWLFGYFWLPCPRCGRMFGGHEKFGYPSLQEIMREAGPGEVWCSRHIRVTNNPEVTR